ncbi:MAG: hypothetical protein WCO98_04350 [bacterium]
MRIADLFAGSFAVFNFDNRSVIRGVYIPRMLVITNVILAIMVIIMSFNTHGNQLQSINNYYSNNTNVIRQYFFSGLVFVQLVILILLPARTANVIIEEKEKENIDHFFLTKLSSFQLVIGKLLSSVGIYLIFFISTIPVLAILISYTGGVSFEEFLIAVLIIIVNIVKLSAICIYLSVRIKKTGPAIVWSYITILMLFFILPSFFTRGTVYNDIFYGSYPNIYDDFIGVGISLIPLLIFVGFMIAEFYFIVRRKVESWKSYIIVSVAGVMAFLFFILQQIIDTPDDKAVPWLNPIEFFIKASCPDLLYTQAYSVKSTLYTDVAIYIAAALIISFAILYLAARRLDVLRWGKV